MLIMILITHVFFRDIGLQAKIDEESTDYEDILQDVFMDSYNNLTLKTLYILRHFVNSHHDILLKTDDDSYIGVCELIFIARYFSCAHTNHFKSFQCL